MSRTADQVFIPLTVGGGVRTVDDIDRLLRAGADKAGINTAAISRPEFLTQAANRFGSQCVVLSVDARRVQGDTVTASGFEVTTHGGRVGTGIDAVSWAAEGASRGAGEILLNSMDADGTRTVSTPSSSRWFAAKCPCRSSPAEVPESSPTLPRQLRRAQMRFWRQASFTSGFSGFPKSKRSSRRPVYPVRL